MANFSGLHILFFSFIIATGAISDVSGTVFTMVNRCNFPVWPGILTGDNGVQLNGGGFALTPGASVDNLGPKPAAISTRSAPEDASQETAVNYNARAQEEFRRLHSPNSRSAMAICPNELSVPNGGSVVACKSACEAFGTPQYCCTGAFDKPETCPPTDYSRIFKTACPKAYSYAYDDATSTFTCANANYSIIFCPTI
uniref:Thaumatin-like protein n=1 Tax=Brassica oleracea TaxID=3712 RepID=A0A3P6GH62_BRAOL|nr:unnamed protein product [Brassica oleracea]